MNIHFDNPLKSQTKQTLTTLSLYNLVKVINKPIHRCRHIIDWTIARLDDDIHIKSIFTDSLESDDYCTKFYIDRPSFIAELSGVSQFSSIEKANQVCEYLGTVLDEHAPPSL